MRRSLGVVIALALCACESNTTEPVASTSTPELATVRVESAIQGDPSLFSNSYVATVDGANAQPMIPGSAALFSVTAGSHMVEVQRSPNFSSWCNAVQPMSEAIKVAAGTEKTLTFSFTCGSITQGGTLFLTIAEPTGKAREVEVILRAGLTVRTDRTYRVQTNKTIELPLAPNFYQLGINSDTCPLEGGVFSALASAFYVLPGMVLNFTIPLRCP